VLGQVRSNVKLVVEGVFVSALVCIVVLCGVFGFFGRVGV
jgi:hypothetical protein